MGYRDTQLDSLIALHNNARTGRWFRKCAPLEKNNVLMCYAQDWANKMAAHKQLVHSDMKAILKLGFRAAAENIAYGQKTPESVMQTWLKSMGHRHNIFNSKLTEIGCGMSLSDVGQLYWCVCFAA